MFRNPSLVSVVIPTSYSKGLPDRLGKSTLRIRDCDGNDRTLHVGEQAGIQRRRSLTERVARTMCAQEATMANVMGMRSGNPALTADTFTRYGAASGH